MSARQREEARTRAVARGKQAFQDGKLPSDNPYKRPGYAGAGRSTGEWSQWPAWNMGYQDAKNAAARLSESAAKGPI